MSVLVRDEATGKLYVYAKGAETKMASLSIEKAKFIAEELPQPATPRNDSNSDHDILESVAHFGA